MNSLKYPIKLSQLLYSSLRRAKDLVRGYYPEAFGYLILRLISRNPKSFQEKILYKMAHDRRPIITTYADKVIVREYVKEKIGEEYLIPLHGIYQNISKISLSDIPENCVIKPSHGSGAILILSTRVNNYRQLLSAQKVDYWKRFEVTKSLISEPELKSLLQNWLDTSYHNGFGHFPEYAYKDIVPKIIVEDLLVTGNEIASDYRFFIFNGICEYIEVDKSWNDKPSRDMFDTNWNQVEVQLKYARAAITPSRPPDLELMIKLAEKLADGIDHVRVDFYLIGNKIYFGEMTNYHTSGKQTFHPVRFNFQFGKSWDPTKYY